MMARAPDECHWMMRHSPLIAMLYQVPEYWAWFKQLDDSGLGELFSHYRLQVQHLQLFCHREHWLSKAPSHPHFMPVLFDVFPDANVVRLHRHPCQAVPSLCSLVAGYRGLISKRVDAGEIGATILDMFTEGMKRSMAAPQHRNQQIIDLSFENLIADPAAAVRRVYAQFGYRFGAAFERDLARAIESERTALRPRHNYSLEQFGLSRAQVNERSAEYLAWVQPRCGELAA